MKNLALAFTIASSSSLTFAADHWSGPGKIYDQNRKLIGDYTVNVSIENTGSASKHIEVVVRSPSGTIIKTSSCDMLSQQNEWKKTCGDGSSEGYMFDYGLGVDYYTTHDGTTFITDMIFDGKASMRLLRYEMQKGKVIHFFAETLKKDQKIKGSTPDASNKPSAE